MGPVYSMLYTAGFSTLESSLTFIPDKSSPFLPYLTILLSSQIRPQEKESANRDGTSSFDPADGM